MPITRHITVRTTIYRCIFTIIILINHSIFRIFLCIWIIRFQISRQIISRKHRWTKVIILTSHSLVICQIQNDCIRKCLPIRTVKAEQACHSFIFIISLATSCWFHNHIIKLYSRCCTRSTITVITESNSYFFSRQSRKIIVTYIIQNAIRSCRYRYVHSRCNIHPCSSSHCFFGITLQVFRIKQSKASSFLYIIAVASIKS